MTADEMAGEVEKLRNQARTAARKRMFPSGMVGDTSSVVNEARLCVIEDTLAGLLAIVAGYPEGQLEEKIGMMLIDYWQKVVAEIGT